MGIGGISIWQLLIILVIIVLLFGTKKLRTLGGDLGTALKSFRDAMRQGEEEPEKPAQPERLTSAESAKTAEGEPSTRERERT
jgi:sec-independent protein translocase protein TatA